MRLREIKPIDLRFSTVATEEGEQPIDLKKGLKKTIEKLATGDLHLAKKEYVNYRDKPRRPDWFFTWSRWDASNNYRELRDKKIIDHYSEVNADKDPFWPEGVEPNAEGHYVYGDLIWVKCPLKDHLQREADRMKLSRFAGRQRLQQFNEQVKVDNAQAGGSPMPDRLLEELSGNL